MAAAAQEETLHWELRDPYPLLPADFQRLNGLYLDDQNRKKTADPAWVATPRTFVERLVGDWEPGRPIVAHPDRVAYDPVVGKYLPGYVKRDGDLVEAVFQIRPRPAPGQVCDWRVQRPSGEGQGGQYSTAEACDVQVVMPVPLGIKVLAQVTRRPAPDAPAEARAGVSAEVLASQKVIAVLGDSYASGEGNPDIPASYAPLGAALKDRPGPEWILDERSSRDVLLKPATWWDKECHRSLLSWPILTTLDMAFRDSERHTRFTVLDYACSGAALLDGVFHAQLNPPGQARLWRSDRDGDTINGAYGAAWHPAVRRSQLNALFEDLCGDQQRYWRIERIPSSRSRQAWVETCAQPVKVNEVLLSVGGNDVDFASMVMGVTLPNEARSGSAGLLVSVPALWLFRSISGAVSLEDAEDDIGAFDDEYALAIDKIRQLANVEAGDMTLVAYPDPVGESSAGCDGDDRSRIRDSNLVLGKVLREVAPFGWGNGWTMSVEPTEVKSFASVYRALSRMQASLRDRGIGVADYLGADPIRDWTICAAQPLDGGPAMPFHFCGTWKKNGKFQECNLEAKGGPWRPQSPQSWKHYRQGANRIVYSMNESIMALQPWSSGRPVAPDLMESLTGYMHPVAQAHAAAAQSVVECRSGRRECLKASVGGGR